MSTERYMECIDVAMSALRTGDAATADAAANLAREIRIGERWLDDARDALVGRIIDAGADGLPRDSISRDDEALVSGLIRDCRVVSRCRDGRYRLFTRRFTADALLATLEAAGVDGMTQSEAEREHGARAVQDAMASGAVVRVRRGGGFRLFAEEHAPKNSPLVKGGLYVTTGLPQVNVVTDATNETDWENLS
jgi:hypothetical protein